jgi:gluconate 5-dehydrogenase
MLGKAFAKDWSRFGIRVNNIGPGYIKTDMTSKRFANKKFRLERQNQTLLGRWGEPDDLIGPCIFLASDASRYMTGQDLYIDGGWIINSGLS